MILPSFVLLDETPHIKILFHIGHGERYPSNYSSMWSLLSRKEYSGLTEQKTCDPPDIIGRSFAADVMRRYRQYIIVMRETVTSLIHSHQDNTVWETHRFERGHFDSVPWPVKPRDFGTSIRIDSAPGLVTLTNDPTLRQYGPQIRNYGIVTNLQP